jgi:hypothetical protein
MILCLVVRVVRVGRHRTRRGGLNRGGAHVQVMIAARRRGQPVAQVGVQRKLVVVGGLVDDLVRHGRKILRIHTGRQLGRKFTRALLVTDQRTRLAFQTNVLSSCLKNKKTSSLIKFEKVVYRA